MASPATIPRVALIGGLRTPFVRQSTSLRAMTALDLGAAVVRELVARTGIAPREVERVVFGQVVPSLGALNIAREVVIESGLPPTTDASSVARACTTSYQTTIDLARAIASGEVAAGIAGGTDVPVAVSKKLAQALIRLGRAKSVADRVMAFRHLTPRDFLPEPPALAERSTGLTMGEHAEQMAQENGIGRPAQDELAHRSHTLAARAWADGRFAEEVLTVYVPPRYEPVESDNLVRRESQLADYAALRPVFDRRFGTITAGNSSALSDGASAILLMREDKARALGLRPLAYLRSHAFTALDPRGQLLMGPAYAIPRALDRAGITFADLDLVDLHEAFAAQVLSVIQALESKAWAAEHLGRGEAIGRLDWTRFNVSGGSIALGHPFAATGARQLTQVARELARRGGGLGLLAACAAGGLGAAIVIEVDP
jgi:acetyl-CoA acyltransferase